MAVSKITLKEGNQVRAQINLQNDTVTEQTVLAGYTFHRADGEVLQGAYQPFIPSGTLNITENGIHNVRSYDSVDVNVSSSEPEPLPASYFNISANIITGFSEEGLNAYNNGEIVDLIIPAIDGNGNPILEIGEMALNLSGDTKIRSITLSEGITTVRSYNFRSMSFSELNLPSTLITLESNSFDNNNYLAELYIPENVRYFTAAFDQCNLSKIVVDPNNQYFHSAENGYEMNAIIRTADNTVILGCKNTDISNSLTITKIDDYAFYMVDIRNMSFPRSLLNVGSMAFSYCSKLETLNFASANITTIGTSAFSECSNLTEIYLPSTIQNIGFSAFHGCKSLKLIQADVTPETWINLDINRNLFNSNVTQPVRVALRGNENAVYNELVGNISIEYSDGIEQSLFVSETILPLNNYVLLQDLNQVSVVNIWEGLFISDVCFVGCSNLTTVQLGSQVMTIGNNAFAGCPLTSVTLSDDLTQIGEYAFANCDQLTEIKLNSGTPPILGTGAFDNTNNCPIIVPNGSYNDYISSETWQPYVSRIHEEEIPEG